ncbi:uncharacterized protein LOC126335067 [Schistocerca gregaria]|uniref:uncharacterized protein LOC126335067 n=1 Tax=Schistocerca gregaria TaxID=7010 RepID=UPI00211E536F|nr:uncharacterized protein LOC126335067 [Schistocerca gregaria]
MSEAGQRGSRRRRRIHRRAACTSASVEGERSSWDLSSRYLATLTAAVEVALCRLQYYLDRTARYQVDMEAHHPLHNFKISSIDTSFRADMANYLRALRKDILRLESARKAMRTALRVQPADVLERAAQSAPTLPQSRGLSSRHQSPAGLRSSSSESEGEQGMDSRVSQWRQRRKGRHSSSVLEFRRQRVPDKATEGGSKRKQSSDSSGAGDIEETGQSGSGADSEREAQESSGNGAGGFDDGDAGAFGVLCAGDGQPCGSGGNGAGDVSRTCPSGGTGVDKDAYPPSGNDYSNDVLLSYDIGAEHETKVGLCANDRDNSKPSGELAVSIGEENVEGQSSTCASADKVKVQATGEVGGRSSGFANASGKNGGSTKSSYSSSRSPPCFAKSGAGRGDENWVAKGGNQEKPKMASGGVDMEASQHSLVATTATIDASSSARDVLRELWRQYGLLCRLLMSHSQRLQLETSAAELPLAEGQQLAVQLLLLNAQLQRNVAAAGVELLRGRTRLGECALRARAVGEAVRRLRSGRSPRPRRPLRHRRTAAAVTVATPSLTPPPSPPPSPQRQADSGFSMERLLSLFLCWSRPTSD